MDRERASLALRELVDRYRAQCLWFLRSDYYPQSTNEIDRVLRQIEQHGDMDALRQTAQLRQWLLPGFSATSAGS